MKVAALSVDGRTITTASKARCVLLYQPVGRTRKAVLYGISLLQPRVDGPV